MAGKSDLRNRIVDTAIELAEAHSWESVRLYDIAGKVGIDLDQMRVHFREKEEIVEAWFDRADTAMLQEAAGADFLALSSGERLHRLIMAWLDALAAHRRVTRQMIAGKLEPGHLHIQVPGLMRISRTVQWIRESARRDATFIRRALEETALTGIYLTTFIYWMRDDSQDSERTRTLLTRLLARAERLSTLLFGRHGAANPTAGSTGDRVS